MSRRKHVLQSLEQDVEPPGEGQHIVRVVGSRGSNIIEVEFPGGRTTLCLMPAKFHKKLWIKNGNYLIVEEAGAEGRVTGQILAVLFTDHVKQLRRMPGVWPAEFEQQQPGQSAAAAAAGQAAEELAALRVAGSDAAERAPGRSGGAPAGPAATAAGTGEGTGGAGAEGAGAGAQEQADGGGGGSDSSSEDDLPPIPRFNNRKVIVYEVSDTDSDD